MAECKISTNKLPGHYLLCCPKKEKYTINDNLTKSWSSNFKTLYLDGNNMLFVDKLIRNLCLKGNRNLADILLIKLSTLFCITTDLEYLYIVGYMMIPICFTYIDKYIFLKINKRFDFWYLTSCSFSSNIGRPARRGAIRGRAARAASSWPGRARRRRS